MESRLSKLESIVSTLATKLDIADLRSEMHKGSGDVIKWVVGTAIAISAAGVTIITFVLNNATPKAAPPQPQPPAIIINVPSQISPAAPVVPPPKP